MAVALGIPFSSSLAGGRTKSVTLSLPPPPLIFRNSTFDHPRWFRSGLRLAYPPPNRALRHQAPATVIEDTDESSLEWFLSVVEAVCVVSSVAFSVGFALLPGCRRLGAAAILAMAAATGIGAWERRRWRWRRRRGATNSLDEDGSSLETMVKNWARVSQGLARQVEKIGNRVRVTRRSLKAEMAELANCNAEAARALAAQQNALEKELAHMHTLLIAMQEQQQKQVNLILAIANTATQQHNTTSTST